MQSACAYYFSYCIFGLPVIVHYFYIARFVPVLTMFYFLSVFTPLNAQLNPICHLLALLGAHHILHISRIRVNAEIRTNESYKMGFFSNLQSNFRSECCHGTFGVTVKKTKAIEHSQYEYWPLSEAVFLIRHEDG